MVGIRGARLDYTVGINAQTQNYNCVTATSTKDGALTTGTCSAITVPPTGGPGQVYYSGTTNSYLGNTYFVTGSTANLSLRHFDDTARF